MICRVLGVAASGAISTNWHEKEAEMPRTQQPNQVASRPVSTRPSDLENRDNTGVYYVGLGDRFDDDRRLVRAEASAPRLAIDPR